MSQTRYITMIDTTENTNQARQAREFLQSIRGQYIISQALHIAMKEITSRPFERQEPSNVSDMQFLYDNLFGIYRDFSKEDLKQMSVLLEDVVDQKDPTE